MTNNESTNVYYVYIHTFDNGKIYVGKGKDGRCYDFRNRSQYWKNVFHKYGDPKVDIILDFLPETAAFELEEFLILEMIASGMQLKNALINLTNGGEGASGHIHNDATKKLISEASKNKWNDPIYKFNLINKLREYNSMDSTKLRKSNISKAMWENRKYRNNHLKVLETLWASSDHINKMKQRMTGSKNPSARTANIYDYKTNELIAENVVSAEWARNNGYSRPKLQVTTKADRLLPSSKNNPHHHKGVYMRYTDE